MASIYTAHVSYNIIYINACKFSTFRYEQAWNDLCDYILYNIYIPFTGNYFNSLPLNYVSTYYNIRIHIICLEYRVWGSRGLRYSCPAARMGIILKCTMTRTSLFFFSTVFGCLGTDRDAYGGNNHVTTTTTIIISNNA